MTNIQEIKEALGDLTDQDLRPHYETIYASDLIDLEDVDELLSKETIDQVTCLIILSNSCKELKADFNNYLLDSYNTLEFTDDRLAFSDIGNISRFIVWKFKSNQTGCFEKIFESAETLLNKGDDTTQNLIVVGLFEGIQNIGAGIR